MIDLEIKELILEQVGSTPPLKIGIPGAFMTINLYIFLNGHFSLSGLLCLITDNDGLPPQSFLLYICVRQGNSRACCCPPPPTLPPATCLTGWCVWCVYITLAAFSDEREGRRLRLNKRKMIIEKQVSTF